MPFFSSKKCKAKKQEASNRAPSGLAGELANASTEAGLQEGVAKLGGNARRDPDSSAESSGEDAGSGRDYGSGSIDNSTRGFTGGGGPIVLREAIWGTTDGERRIVRRAAQDVAVAAVSAGLMAGGISSVIAPVIAVVIVVGHVVIRGVTRLVERRVRVRVDQQAHLEQLQLTRAQAADHLTMIINGVLDHDGQHKCYNAFLSPNDNQTHAQVNSGHLTGLSKLIGSSMKCNVRDMGGFTEAAEAPFSVRLSMPDVLALIRQSWEYERFAETKCGTMTVIVIKAQRGKTKLLVAWNNHGDLGTTEGKVYTEREWKKTGYSGKIKNMPDGFADVDVALETSLIFV